MTDSLLSGRSQSIETAFATCARELGLPPLLLDQNITYNTRLRLSDAGFDCLTVSRIGLRSAPDWVLLKQAHDLSRVLVTHDKDFVRKAELIASNKAGIVVLPAVGPRPKFAPPFAAYALDHFMYQLGRGNVTWPRLLAHYGRDGELKLFRVNAGTGELHLRRSTPYMKGPNP